MCAPRNLLTAFKSGYYLFRVSPLFCSDSSGARRWPGGFYFGAVVLQKSEEGGKVRRAG